ncbi:MAG: DUF4922 domain-containing protein [Bacteroidales bacterium]|nr:DUF4922 domain-containing protein [Bacteroidales bacterium]
MNITAEVNELIERQLRQWDAVARNYEALARVETRELQLCGSRVLLQFNPERIRSSAAKVDAASLKARKCFLCREHQPQEQEMVSWHGKYKIQVNPYPIFPRHLTIALMEHVPQSVMGRVGDMLQLAADLPDFVLFYNGAKCGASAPDHMHFQAGNKGFMPFCDEYAQGILTTETFAGGKIAYCASAPCRPFVISSDDATEVEGLFDRLALLLPLADGDAEPMMNVLCWKAHSVYHLAIFPRVKHRPSNYGDGAGQFVLSPASVDMGQAIAVPVEKDFRLLTALDVEAMMNELCLSSEAAHNIIKLFNSKYA